MKLFKTYSQKSSEVSRRWVLIDASEAPLGRVATTVATYLMGKKKPTYTPHMDAGDYVVVINAANVVVTGTKEEDKSYYHYSGYPGGMKSRTVAELRATNPDRIIRAAVQGMLPTNRLRDDRLSRLKIFAGAEHAHTAQKPEKVEVTK